METGVWEGECLYWWGGGGRRGVEKINISKPEWYGLPSCRVQNYRIHVVCLILGHLKTVATHFKQCRPVLNSLVDQTVKRWPTLF